jgi:hypothetical protein
MISVRPGTPGHRVLCIFALLDEPTGGEIATRASVEASEVPRLVARLREGGYLTGTEYRIANPVLLARLGASRYATLGADLDDDSERLATRIVLALVERGPMHRDTLAEILGVAPNDGAFAEALATCNVTNEPTLTPKGRAAVEAP